MKKLAWILAAVAALFVLVALTVPRGHPDETRVRRDFLAEHPSYTIDRVALDEREVVAVCYRVFYRVPDDATLREELRQYLQVDGRWRISDRGERGR